MIPLKTIIKKPLKDKKGFTLMELMVVIAIISVLASIAIFNYIPMRAKALDSAAHSDARNVMSTIINGIMVNTDVVFNNVSPVVFNNVAPGGAIGATQTDGTPRKPLYVLSNGVAARIVGASNLAPDGNNTIFAAFIYHTGGTSTGDPSGKKEYYVYIDADQGVSTAPSY